MLRSIFEQAHQSERALIFIDEIDALAVRRDNAQEDFSRRLVGQFLPLLDGMDNDGRVVVIAATNRPDAIDPAFRRPGRFDREVHIGIPNEISRYEILKIHTRKMQLSSEVNLKKIAEMTHGYVGADLEAICREAGICALNNLVQWEEEHVVIPQNICIEIQQQHFLKAINGFIPSTLRDIKTDIPSIDWDNDIVGLPDTKTALIEAIELPFRYLEMLKTQKNSSYSFCEAVLIGEKGSGRKTLVYGLAKKLGLRCLEINLIHFIFHHNNGIESAFYRLKELALASSPCIILLPEIDCFF